MNQGSTVFVLSPGHLQHLENLMNTIWKFPKIRGTLLWGPYNKDPTV